MKAYVEGTNAREACLRVLLSRSNEVVNDPDEADLIVVGPEVPLVLGYADKWRAKGKAVYGPGTDGARLEGSKAYLKDFLERAGVPTAKYGAFNSFRDAEAFLKTMQPPYVIKTSGLAAGKGVLVTDSIGEALVDLDAKLTGRAFGEAGETVVIEEGLSGKELSLFVVFDGKQRFVLPPARDYKRLLDGDEGPNTGGMGALTPVDGVDDALLKRIEKEIVDPTCEQLQRDAIDYRGTLYAGIMLTEDGPKVLEYNVRFGDPDSQVSLMCFDGDLFELLYSAAKGSLVVPKDQESTGAAVNIVASAQGYPIQPRLGDAITGLEDARSMENIYVFEAGMKSAEGGFVTSGGRVLNVLCKADNIEQARDGAYKAINKILFAGMHFRHDIASSETTDGN